MAPAGSPAALHGLRQVPQGGIPVGIDLYIAEEETEWICTTTTR